MNREKLEAIVLEICTQEKVYKRTNILSIIAQLAAKDEYTDAVTLWLALKANGSKVSIASVYRILHWLMLKGLVQRILTKGSHQHKYRVNLKNINQWE